MKFNFTIIATAFLLSTLLTASGCKKDNTTTEEQLPPETQTGAFTIGFKVDGKVYSAKGKGGLLADERVSYSYFSSDSTFYIEGSKSIENKFGIYFTFKCFTLNSPSLLKVFPFEANFLDKTNGTLLGVSNSYNTDTNNIGYVTLKFFNGTFNPGNFGTIVSGTFDFYAINGNGKVIHITEGRFDIGR